MTVTEDRDEVDTLEASSGTDFEMSEVSSQTSSASSNGSSIWHTIRRIFFQTPAERRASNRERLQSLSQAIEQYPAASVNYLLRGELHLELQQYQLAREDLEKALDLAQTQFENDRWGLTSQAIQDRARRSLQRLPQQSDQ